MEDILMKYKYTWVNLHIYPFYWDILHMLFLIAIWLAGVFVVRTQDIIIITIFIILLFIFFIRWYSIVLLIFVSKDKIFFVQKIFFMRFEKFFLLRDIEEFNVESHLDELNTMRNYLIPVAKIKVNIKIKNSKNIKWKMSYRFSTKKSLKKLKENIYKIKNNENIEWDKYNLFDPKITLSNENKLYDISKDKRYILIKILITILLIAMIIIWRIFLYKHYWISPFDFYTRFLED